MACNEYGIAVEYRLLTLIESPLFSRLVYDYLDDDEYAELQAFLAVCPEAGRLVRGSGGVRKVRWSRAGTGKSGGVRVIYFARTHRDLAADALFKGRGGQYPGARAQGAERGSGR